MTYLEVCNKEGQPIQEFKEEVANVISWNHSIYENHSEESSTPLHNHLQISKYLDETSPFFMDGCWKSKKMAMVKLHCLDTENDNHEYLLIVLKNVVVADFSLSGGGSDKPYENLALKYDEISYQYTIQKGKTIEINQKVDLKKN